MSYKIRIDWVTLTGKLSKNEGDEHEINLLSSLRLAEKLVWGLGSLAPSLETVPPERHYSYAFVDRHSKLRVNVSTDISGQGWKVEASGSACNELDLNQDLQSFAEVWRAKVTRFDVAVDLIDTGLKVHEFAEECAEAWGHESGRLWNFRKGKTGNTCYIGSGSSERYFRLYDKGGEQGIPVDWMRAELEYKGAHARHAAEAYFSDYGLCVANIVDFISLPHSSLSKILKRIAAGVEPERLVKPRVVGDRERWLNTQVLAAYTKFCMDDLEAARTLWEKFHDTWMAAAIWKMFNDEFDKQQMS